MKKITHNCEHPKIVAEIHDDGFVYVKCRGCGELVKVGVAIPEETETESSADIAG